MTLEEKLHIKLDWMNVKHIAVDVIIQDIVVICQQEINEACKKQREICADAFMTKEDYLYIKLNTPDTISTLKRDEILNAPSPKESE